MPYYFGMLFEVLFAYTYSIGKDQVLYVGDGVNKTLELEFRGVTIINLLLVVSVKTSSESPSVWLLHIEGAINQLNDHLRLSSF